MEPKIELENQARRLIETSPHEAVVLYEKLWSDFNESFNKWDAFFYLKALKIDLAYESPLHKEVVQRFKDEARVSGMYSWYIFDKYIRGAKKNDLIRNERAISSLFELGKQEDHGEKQDYPCPYTISVFQLTDAYAENLFNAKKINELLDLLKPDFLSPVARKIQTEIKGEVEVASDKEKYYLLKTKALLKLGKYAECIELCDKALGLFKDFHYNDDIWFKMRKAICYDNLGDHELGEKLLHETLSTKAGSDKWFLYKDVAEIYFDQEEYEKSWIFSVNACYYGNEAQFMINLYLLQARILYKLNRKEEGVILAKLLASILKEQQWKPKPEFEKLFKYYQINFNELLSVDHYFIEAKEFWNAERYKGIDRAKGEIQKVHESGKKGKIKSTQGFIYNFSRKDFRVKVRDLNSLVRSKVEFFPIIDSTGQAVAEDIVITEKKESIKPPSGIVGNEYIGKINSIHDFGILIAIPVVGKGLIPKKALPNDFMTKFSVGEQIDVKVVEETNKGLLLQLSK